ncbi:GntR family transcriptional regulator [Ferrimonas balearica]|nr:GntR family transcriptional regulator [Ferrimonas balearica]
MAGKFDGFGPLQTSPLRDQVYTALRQRISNGLFPDTGVVEQELSETLQVSRTPVREALFQLCREGVLVKRGRGYHLPPLSPEERSQISEVREVLDPLMVRLALKRSSETILERLRPAYIAEQAAHRAGDTRAFVQAHAEFRAALRDGARNGRLAQIIELLDDQIIRQRMITHAIPENRDHTLRTHARIIAAAETGEPELGAEAMEELMRFAQVYLNSC